MKKIKKLTALILSVLMVMSVFSVVSFAAENECVCGSNDFYYNGYANCTYAICRNCGLQTLYCDHAGYDYADGIDHWYYCSDVVYCKCGKAVISGTKHQLGEFVNENREGYYLCELCGDYIYVSSHDKADLTVDGSGNYTCEWLLHDRETGAVSGSGEAYYDKKSRTLTVRGTGACDLYSIMENTVGYRPCKNCSDGHFYALKSITDKVVVEEGITYLYDFPSTSSVKEIVLPETLEGLKYEFYVPEATVNIPSKLKLDRFILAKEYKVDNNPNFTVDKNGSLYSKDMTVLYAYKGTEKEVKLPSTVKEIGYGAFWGNNYIEKLTVPSSVKKIGEHAFTGCCNLKDVSLSYGLEEIGDAAFGSCISLEEIVLPDSVTDLGASSFAGCTSLKYVKLSEKLKNIHEGAFSLCFGLTVITIPSSVEKIDVEAFAGCYYLEEFNIYSDTAELDNSTLGLIGGYYDDEFINEFLEVYTKLLKIEMGLFTSADYDTDNYPSIEEYVDCIAGELSEKFNDLAYELFNSYDSPIASDILTIYCNEGSTAEAYAIENGIKYAASACEHSFGEWVADEANGVRYKTCSKCGKTYEEELEPDDDTIDIEGNEGDNKFTVKLIENPESTEYIYIRGLVEGNIVALYDINLLDENGNKVQPDGTVKVSLPLGADVTYFTVLRINDDGTLTDMKAVREGDSVVFETDHFSYYVILGGETEADTGDNIKCNCFCHSHPVFEIIVKIFKLLTEFFGGPLTFACDC